MKIKFIALVLPLAFGLSSSPARPQETVDDSHVYCSLSDSVHSVLYVSGVFLGDSKRATMYADEFRTHLHLYYPRLYGTPDCVFAASREEAERRKASWESRVRGLYHSVVETGWMG